MNHATMDASIVFIESPGGEKKLVIVVNTQCSACGAQSLVFPAHHTRALIKMLQQVVERLPDDITGGDDDISELPEEDILSGGGDN